MEQFKTMKKKLFSDDVFQCFALPINRCFCDKHQLTLNDSLDLANSLLNDMLCIFVFQVSYLCAFLQLIVPNQHIQGERILFNIKVYNTGKYLQSCQAEIFHPTLQGWPGRALYHWLIDGTRHKPKLE